MLSPPLSVFWSQSRLIIERSLVFEPIRQQFVLESKVAQIQKDRFVILSLDDFFNNDGIATPMKPGNFDNLGSRFGAYYPEELIPEELVLDGVPFFLSKVNENNVRCNSQILLIEPALNVLRVHILASANHGDYKTFVLLNDQPVSINVSDWCRPPKDYELEYRYIQSGEKQHIKCGLDRIVIDLRKPTVLYKIGLPDDINVHIFSITLEISE